MLHASPLQIGILSALPQLVGTCAQLISIRLLQSGPAPKALIALGGIGQAVAWVPLLLLPLLFPHLGASLLIGCAAVYLAFGHLAIPAWNSMLIDLTDPHDRGAYFAQRARVTALISFLALTGAGCLLHLGELWGKNWAGFATIFLAASLARATATHYQGKIARASGTHPTPVPSVFLPLLGRESTSRDFRRFLLFSGLMHFATLIAGPYFVLYLLRDLKLSYLQYGGWMAVGIAGQFLTFRTWGRFSDRFGNKALLTLTGFAVPFLPIAYLLGTDYVLLLCINLMGGIVWAGLSLGLQNYVFDAVAPEERAAAVALTNATNALGWFAGAMSGSWLAAQAPPQLEFFRFSLTPASNLVFVFAISGALRFVVVTSLVRFLAEPRHVERCGLDTLLPTLLLVKPFLGFSTGKRVRGIP